MPRKSQIELTPKHPTLLGFRPGAIKLWVAALLVAVTLCGSEVNYLGNRDVIATDQMNNLIFTISMVESILDGFLPPRVSPLLTQGLGNPSHQFYSPFAHFCTAVFSLLLGDAVTGFSFFSIFVLALAFVYTYRIGRHLTLSSVCAATSAFLFATAPYLSTDRVLRGAFPEYVAFCLLPVALYYNIRALSMRRFRHWALAVVSTASVILSHLITGYYFLFFYAVFLLLVAVCWLARHVAWRIHCSGGVSAVDVGGLHPGLPSCPRPRRLAMKGLVAASIAISAVLLDMYCLGPAVLYDDLMIKTKLLTWTTADSGYMTPVLSLFSLTDHSWNRPSWLKNFVRLQVGLVLIVSYAAFIYFCVRRSTSWALPFAVTAGLVLLAVARPYVFLLPPLSWVDIAQFSYRLLTLFTLCASVCGALAMSALFKTIPGFGPGARCAAAMSVIALALALSAPYLNPGAVKGKDGVHVGTAQLYHRSSLTYGEADYLRPPPEPDAGPDVWVDIDRMIMGGVGNPGGMRFKVRLEDYYPVSGGPPGEVLLNVLHYPGLQKIEILVDGRPANVGVGTYWQARKSFEGLDLTKRSAFHGIRITGAPSSGLLEIRVRFTGYSWANWTSLFSLVLLVAGSAWSTVRDRERRKSRVRLREREA